MQYYDEYLRQDDRLGLMKQVIDCEAFRSIHCPYFNDRPSMEPHNDEVAMFRCLVF